MNTYSDLSAVSEYLSIALEGVRQITFDWNIPSNKLHFSGELAGGLNSVLLDMSRACNARELPEIVHDRDREEFRACLLNALKAFPELDGIVHTAEVRLQDTSCEWRWVEIAGKIVERNDDGRATRMVGTLSDIHTRKQAELQLAKLRSLYAASSHINQAIVRFDNRDELFDETCRSVVEHGGLGVAWIGLAEHETQALMPVAAYGNGLDALRNALASHLPAETRPIVCNDIFDAAHFPPCHKAALQSGFRSFASFPFRHSGQAIGSLNLYAKEKDFFDQATIDLLQEMTKDISFAIDNYERESRRRHAEALQLGQNRILNMVATGVALPEILGEIAHFVQTHSHGARCSIWQLDAEGERLSDGIAPNLPQAYVSHLAELAIGPCAIAMHPLEPVITADIASDPLWAAGRDLANKHGIKACVSWPIFGKNRKILGTFALHFHDDIAPTDSQLFHISSHLAGIAIESRASEEKIRYLAHYDGLTGLANRFLFHEYLELALRSAQRHARKFAVLFLDLDKFKEINDTLGHEAGDEVLRETAARLRGTLRHTDKIARMGGDEFYVLIEDLMDGHYASEVARKLLEEASRPIRLGDRECRLSVSIGIAIYPGDGNDGQTLLKNADSAMYRAKEGGKNGYRFFSNVVAGKAVLLEQLSDELVRA